MDNLLTHFSSVEVISITAVLLRISRASFLFPHSKPRVKLMDHPEIALMAVMITAVKLIMPFQGTLRVIGDLSEVQMPKMDWKAWVDVMSESVTTDAPGRRNYKNITADDVVAMTAEELNDYLAYVSTYIETQGKDASLCSSNIQLVTLLTTL